MSNTPRLFGITLVSDGQDQLLGTFVDTLEGAKRLARALADATGAKLRLHHVQGAEVTVPGNSKLTALNNRLRLALLGGQPPRSIRRGRRQ